MGWTLFQLSFKLLSGIHAGTFPVGNILRTRGYVSGRMFWGAATAALVGNGLHRRTQEGFERAGEQTRASLRFGYLFPFASNEDYARPTPGCIERTDEWEYRFLDTYSSTAINYDQGAAEQGSLHEIEYIRACTRATLTERSSPVKLVGHLAVREGDGVRVMARDVDFCGVSLRTAFSRIQLGGKRGYGFGRAQVDRDFVKTSELFGCRFLAEDGSVILPGGVSTPAHVEIERSDKPEPGSPEPFIGREWRGSAGFGSGQYITDAVLCWAPGTCFKNERRYKATSMGVWRGSSTG